MNTTAVVIPAFNAENTLGEAIESVLRQSAPAEAVVVVDDGSKDETQSIARSYAPEVRCVTVSNGGVARARNIGVAESHSDYVAFLDADDLWHEDKLAKQHAALSAAPGARMSTTAGVRVDDTLRPVGPLPARADADQCRALLLGSMSAGPVSSGLIDRRLFDGVGGFSPQFSQCADWDLWLRLSLRTRIAVVPEPLVRYRVSSSNMSRNIELLEIDTFAVLDRFFGLPAARQYAAIRPEVYSRHWMIVAGSYYRSGQIGRALGAGCNAVRLNPRAITRPLGLPLRRLSAFISPGRRRP